MVAPMQDTADADARIWLAELGVSTAGMGHGEVRELLERHYDGGWNGFSGDQRKGGGW